jgi:hypothetical protein
MLIKLRAPAGPARTEVLQLAEIFRARVVDVSEGAITLVVSGDPGKVRRGSGGHFGATKERQSAGQGMMKAVA